MTGSESDPFAQVRELADRVAHTAHEDISEGTLDALRTFAGDVEQDLEGRELAAAAGKLLAFWESFVGTKLDQTPEGPQTIAAETIRRFEQAFDQDVIGIDLYQALETLAIVEDMPAEDTDEDRLAQWSARVHSLTKDFVAHLENHQE